MIHQEILEIALNEYGVKEIIGPYHNEEILKYFELIGHDWVKTDETAWCSAFMNYCAKVAGYEHTGALNARSWMQIGLSTQPELGAICVLWRESPQSWKGHIGQLINIIGDEVFILGGNQDNKVCIKSYPRARVLGYRKLAKL